MAGQMIAPSARMMLLGRPKVQILLRFQMSVNRNAQMPNRIWAAIASQLSCHRTVFQQAYDTLIPTVPEIRHDVPRAVMVVP
jgi:hypothetical protein